MEKFKTFSAQQTEELGKCPGKILKSGDVVCMKGDLGTGKTCFTHGIAYSMGIEGYITSPTFTIINEYNASVPLYHFDVYRIGEPEEMFDIGFEEYINGDGVTVIEWANLIEEVLPKEYIGVEILKDLSAGENARVIGIEFRGGSYKDYGSRLEQQFLEGVERG